MNKALGLQHEDIIPQPADRDSQVRAVEGAANDDWRLDKLPPVEAIPSTLTERLTVARERLRLAAEHGLRIRVYEIALDLDMSEFHFARQFRAAYGCSPHVYYDEIRAARARDLLQQGMAQGPTARLIGLRRPAELRALLAKRQCLTGMDDLPNWAAAN